MSSVRHDYVSDTNDVTYTVAIALANDPNIRTRGGGGGAVGSHASRQQQETKPTTTTTTPRQAYVRQCLCFVRAWSCMCTCVD